MADKQNISKKLIKAAFDLATTQRWSTLSMETIAQHAKIPINQAFDTYRNREALLDDVMQGINTTALKEISGFTKDDTIKDKLFALLMARLDALAPHRAGMAAIIHDTMIHPRRLMQHRRRLIKSMALMLEAAGVSTNGLTGLVKTNGLAVIFVNAMRVWLKDETEDQGASMAALDMGLRRVDRLVATICAVCPSSITTQ